MVKSPIINGLWIGDQLSALELLCIKSFLDHGHIFHLWTYQPISTPDWEGLIQQNANKILPEKYVFRYTHGNKFGHGKGSLAGFSDIFRYKLLWEKGGWWSDMDICCLKPLDFDAPYVFRSHDVLPVVGNLMKCPSNSPLMKYCFERASKEVTTDNRDWLKPIKILNEGVQKFNLASFIAPNISNPDRWEMVDYHRFFYGKKKKSIYIFHWMNEEWRAKNISKDVVVESSFLASLMKQHEVQVGFQERKIEVKLFYVYLRRHLVPLVPYPVRKFLKKIFFVNRY